MEETTTITVTIDTLGYSTEPKDVDRTARQHTQAIKDITAYLNGLRERNTDPDLGINYRINEEV